MQGVSKKLTLQNYENLNGLPCIESLYTGWCIIFVTVFLRKATKNFQNLFIIGYRGPLEVRFKVILIYTRCFKNLHMKNIKI